ncbi:ammonium transporter [Dacryopinax primogenitus]|uniref:Ammonium transporter n=1 Tax=Dacryopinax primogenitus (strain DJM 731) TaxID=1858805 RepID=M5FVE8_DACPD|nr:ammonium transporter [Dacryopinax primogenitus]EJT99584.1 ammonium transporter [Dacryopinax primogenitus]
MSTPTPSPSYNAGDISYIILCTALVFFMVPGLAFLYSGLARRKSALSLVLACAFSNAVGIFVWYFWGYSLAFSPTASNGYIGNLYNFALQSALSDPSPNSPFLPTLLYAFYESGFACVTLSILMGALAERGRVLPGALAFSALWLTLVYCPLAYWAWGTNGWAFRWGVLDYAGGGPVEIGSGVGGLAYSWVLGRRTERELVNFRPHNVGNVALGTFVLWLGWLGFNGGSAFGANLRAVLACANSNLCAAMGGIAWCLLDWRVERKYTMVGFCSGTIAGLVAATPASGYLPLWASVVLGLVAGVSCNFATKIKFLIGIDDALDLFAEHALAGIIGLLFNGLFASSSLTALDGVTSISGGWTERNWRQMYVQIGYIAACCAYTFVVTALLAWVLNKLPGCALRAGEEAERKGMDEDQVGEFAQDFIEVRRDYMAWGLGEESCAASLGERKRPVPAEARHEAVLVRETEEEKEGGEAEGDVDLGERARTEGSASTTVADSQALPERRSGWFEAGRHPDPEKENV